MSIMKTLVIVKKNSTSRYYIYNERGTCVALAQSMSSVHSYLDEVLTGTTYKQYIFTYTVDRNVIIVHFSD